METLRETNGISLNKGDGMARGLYNMSRGEKAEEITYWFGQEEADRLEHLPDNEYEEEFEKMVDQAIDTQIEEVKSQIDWMEEDLREKREEYKRLLKIKFRNQ